MTSPPTPTIIPIIQLVDIRKSYFMGKQELPVLKGSVSTGSMTTGPVPNGDGSRPRGHAIDNGQ